jgi:hypothetical protein
VRTRVRIIALAVAYAVVHPAAASADWFITPYLGIKFASSTSLVDLEQGASNPKMTLGVSATLLSDRILGIEGEFGYYPRFFERSGTSDLVSRSHVTTLFGNVVFALPRAITRESLRPYAVAGVGLIHVGIDDLVSILPVDTNLLGLGIGGGALGRLTNRTSVRFEVRHIRNLVPANENVLDFGTTGRPIKYWRATVGVSLHGNLF